MNERAMEEIKNEVASNKVLIYMKGTPDMPMCRFSARAVGILSGLSVPFTGVNVLDDAEKWQAVKLYSDWPTIPQIFVGGEFIGGGDQLVELSESGKLKELVTAATG